VTMSMTGYGRAEVKLDAADTRPACIVWIEVRSFNHRFLSLKSRLPDSMQALAPDVEKGVRRRLRRGSVLVTVDLKVDAGDASALVDTDLLASYAVALDRLAKERGCEGASLDALIALPGVIRDVAVSPESVGDLAPAVMEALDAALNRLVEMRRAEGEHLNAVLGDMADRLAEYLGRVRDGRPQVIDDYRERLRTRISQILEREGLAVDEGDIVREVALFADRSDIAEELDRLDGHIAQLRKFLQDDDAAGKRIEFIVQEMFREANTMLAKISDPALSEQALAIKSEVEKVKEQALNVE